MELTTLKTAIAVTQFFKKTYNIDLTSSNSLDISGMIDMLFIIQDYKVQLEKNPKTNYPSITDYFLKVRLIPAGILIKNIDRLKELYSADFQKWVDSGQPRPWY